MPQTDSGPRATHPVPTPVAGSWAIDPTSSSAQFKVRGIFGHWVTGVLPVTAGRVDVAGDPPLPTAVEARLDPAAVSTRNKKRDEHLRSADLFDAEAHPEWTFVADSVRERDGRWQIVGSLTVRGVTRLVTFAAEEAGSSEQFIATTTLDRRDFDVKWGPRFMVGHQVHVRIDVKLVAARNGRVAPGR